MTGIEKYCSVPATKKADECKDLKTSQLLEAASKPKPKSSLKSPGIKSRSNKIQEIKTNGNSTQVAIKVKP